MTMKSAYDIISALRFLADPGRGCKTLAEPPSHSLVGGGPPCMGSGRTLCRGDGELPQE